MTRKNNKRLGFRKKNTIGVEFKILKTFINIRARIRKRVPQARNENIPKYVLSIVFSALIRIWIRRTTFHSLL